MPDIYSEILQVVEAGNCSGCGRCVTLSDNLEMKLNANGFLRPTPNSTKIPEGNVNAFKTLCPGVSVIKRDEAECDGVKVDIVFGTYYSIWEGWATDETIRSAGSSGGVITALSLYSLKSRRAESVTSVSSRIDSDYLPIVSSSTSESECLKCTGSRYAPVSVATSSVGEKTLVVGKPCEISSISGVRSSGWQSESRIPTISFFCAGTPSAFATQNLVSKLLNGERANAISYRGNGYPGYFQVESSSGVTQKLTYEESWGENLGRSLQARCRICPDGLGHSADIVVGDYWEISRDGYPELNDSLKKGTSVVIARTELGNNFLLGAYSDGAVELREIDLSRLYASQPLQILRSYSLMGRLMGQVFLGRKIPKYRGFHLMRFLILHPVLNLRGFLGTLKRRSSIDNGK